MLVSPQMLFKANVFPAQILLRRGLAAFEGSHTLFLNKQQLISTASKSFDL